MSIPSSTRSRTAVAQPNTTSWLWLGMVTCAIVYGSLIPFDLDVRSLGMSGLALWRRIGFQQSTVEDFLSNIVFYVPLGFVVAAQLDRRKISFVIRVVLTMFVGIMLSVFMECLQATAQSRLASWVDVYSNAWGAIFGALLAGGSVQSAFRRPIRWLDNANYSSLPLLGSAFTLAVLVYNLIPLDFVRGLPDLEASFRNAQWSLLKSKPVLVNMPPYSAMAHELAGAAWFALLGFIHARLAIQKYDSKLDMLMSAFKHTVILAFLIEFLQLFFRSHVFDFATIVLRVLAALIGAWISIFFVTPSLRKLWKTKPALTSVLLCSIAILQIVLLTAQHYDPRFVWPDVFLFANAHWLPFNALWHLPVLTALAKIAQVLVVYGSLGITLYAMASCFTVTQHRWILCTLFVTMLATLMETLDFVRPTGQADVTIPLLAAFSVGLTAKAWHLMVPKFLKQELTPHPPV